MIALRRLRGTRLSEEHPSRFFTAEGKEGRILLGLRDRPCRTPGWNVARSGRCKEGCFVQLRLRSRSPERNGGEAPWADREILPFFLSSCKKSRSNLLGNGLPRSGARRSRDDWRGEARNFEFEFEFLVPNS
jgi:hypothetical protein